MIWEHTGIPVAVRPVGRRAPPTSSEPVRVRSGHKRSRVKPAHKETQIALWPDRSTRQSFYWKLQGELATQGDNNFFVGEAQSPGTGHEVRRHATEQMTPVRGRCSSGPDDAGATAAAGGEHSLLLELTIGARDRADSDSQVAGELAQRGKPVAGADLSRRDQVRELAPQLLVRRGWVVRVKCQDDAHRVPAGCAGDGAGSFPGATTRPRNQPSNRKAERILAMSTQPTGGIQAR